jgi:uncharacterized protein with beta-barrel porin domain
MRRLGATVAAIGLLASTLPTATRVGAQTLDSFGVLGGSTVTNTGSTIINGNVGVSTGSAITGLGTTPSPGVVVGTLHSNDQVAIDAQTELVIRIGDLLALGPSQDLTGQDLGGLTLTPGVYNFDSSASLTGPLTLDAQGDPNAVFVFQIGSTLTTASASSVLLIGGAQGTNVSWVVGSSATLGTTSTFAGRILAVANITLTTGATIDCGSAWAQTEAVTLDSNIINAICAFSAFGGVLGPTATENQLAVAAAIDAFVEGGGDLPQAFQDLLDLIDGLSPEEQAAAFSQLSGEAATGVAPTGFQAMNSFLSLVLNSGPGSERTGPKIATVKALGYASTGSASPAGSAIASFGQSSDSTFLPGGWDMWAAAFGSESNTDGSSSAGSHDRSSSVLGIAGGFDFDITPDTRVGIAFGGGGTDFDLSDALGGGSSKMFQTAIYSRTNFDEAYLVAALAYGYHDISTDRTVTVLGEDRFSAAFSGHNVAGEIEGGYRLGWATPYGALRLQSFHTPSYSETTESGSPDFALDYDANTALTARTELGARFEHIVPLDNGVSWALRSRIAWAHDFWSGLDREATFQALEGSPSFTVSGAEPASDSLLLSAGTEIGFNNGVSLAGWFDSEFAVGSQTYSGNARVSYAW